jgi:NAD(P)-dependent dehydrogenase (short-subunit alcohol dehydrogenase family)
MNSILITGGTGQLGKKLVDNFVKKNFQVILTSTSKTKISNIYKKYRNNSNLHCIHTDFTKDNLEKLLHEIKKNKFKINHLINCARSLKSLKVKKNGITDRDDFLNEFLIDVVIPYELSMQLFLLQPKYLKTVTNIGSKYGVVAPNKNLYKDFNVDSPIQYGTSKAALHHLTKELAVRFAEKGIRVNCIAFGGFEGRVNNSFKKKYAKLTPIRRMLKISEVVGPVEYLINDENSSINGHTIVADGGWTIW